MNIGDIFPNEAVSRLLLNGRHIGAFWAAPLPRDVAVLRRYDAVFVFFHLTSGIHEESTSIDPDELNQLLCREALPDDATDQASVSGLIICVADMDGLRSLPTLANFRVLPLDPALLDCADIERLRRSLRRALIAGQTIHRISPFSWTSVCPPRMFFGRKLEIARILESPDQSFAVVGPRMIGKSSLLFSLRRALATHRGQTFVYVNCQGIREYDHFSQTLTHHLEGSGRYSMRQEALDTLILRTATKQRTRFVIALDEFDEIAASTAPETGQLRALISSPRLRGRCRFVVAGYSGLWRELFNNRSAFFNLFTRIELGPLSPEDAAEFIKTTLAELQIPLADSRDSVNAIVALSGGIPWLLQALCERVLEEVVAHPEMKPMGAIESAASSLELQQTVFSCMTGEATDVANLLLSYLADKERALSESEIHSDLAAVGIRMGIHELLRELNLLAAGGAIVRHGSGYRLSNGVLRAYLKCMWEFARESTAYKERYGEIDTLRSEPVHVIPAGSDPRRFALAFSFPGELRTRVSGIAESLVGALGRERIFYDQWFQHELARPNLDTYLQDVYHDQSEIVVLFLCSDYEKKEWCGLEVRAVRDLIKSRKDSQIMLLRTDAATVGGFLPIDGYVDIRTLSDSEVAKLILRRLDLVRREAAGSIR